MIAITDDVIATSAATAWTPVCGRDELEPMWGETALVGGTQVGVVLLPDGTVRAFSNADPHTGAAVMARGIVGSRGGVPTIASPLHKDVYDLDSGACLTDTSVCLPIWRVRLTGDVVEVAAPTVLVGASHGTSDPAGRRAVAGLLDAVRTARPELPVLDAFVDVQEPDVPTVLRAADPGAEAVVVPLLLSAGFHVHVDLAEAAAEAAAERTAGAPGPAAQRPAAVESSTDSAPGVVVGGALGPDVRLAHVLARRLHDAGLTPDDHVVLAAAGSTDASAVADCHTVGAMLAVVLDRPVTVSFISAAEPRLPDAVAATRTAAAGVGRVAVATYLLAPGYFADLAVAAGGDLTSRPLLVEDAPPPAELVGIVLDRHDAVTTTTPRSHQE
ncbi:nitrite reductase small subunit NirD [Curtobacterium sp. ISL-83]|uniref:nitrite reductase small subunit NirD n=1 Tax=Curtobacterium sp. ISL-83 TaxID=2819145 RepID=UPI001BE7D7EB|nr:nitrite reductase small subunit NirD [Curtobacterium sp. ISL-83]MBT2501049.1 nitrite reductase small subunit NirD [Curtobacterium sp. ISL-83]